MLWKIQVCEENESLPIVNTILLFIGELTQSQSHGAEADSLTLLRITAALGQDWLDWVEDKCYLIDYCQAMWHMA